MWLADVTPDPSGVVVSWGAASAVILPILGAFGVFVRWLMGRQDDLAKQLGEQNERMVALLTSMVADSESRTERVVAALVEAASAMRELRLTVKEMRREQP